MQLPAWYQLGPLAGISSCDFSYLLKPISAGNMNQVNWPQTPAVTHSLGISVLKDMQCRLSIPVIAADFP